MKSEGKCLQIGETNGLKTKAWQQLPFCAEDEINLYIKGTGNDCNCRLIPMFGKHSLSHSLSLSLSLSISLPASLQLTCHFYYLAPSSLSRSFSPCVSNSPSLHRSSSSENFIIFDRSVEIFFSLFFHL